MDIRNKVKRSVLPTRNMDKSTSRINTSRKLEPLNKTNVNERSIANKQEKPCTSHSLHPLPKNGKKKIIPIRHTLTSKLRMEKANPLLTTTLPISRSEPTPIKEINTPMRRSTFHPGMQMKTKLDFKNISSSEKKPTQKQNIALIEKKRSASSLSKENKPPIAGSIQDNKVSKVGRSVVSSKSSQPLAVNKGRFVSSQKDRTSSVQNKSLSVPSRYVVANARSKPDPPVEIKKASFKPVTSISVPKKTKTNLKNNSTATESRRLTYSSRNQIIRPSTSVGPVVKKQLKSILRKSASAGDLRKTSEKAKESGLFDGTDTPSLATKSLNKSLKSVAFYSPLQNSTFSPLNIVNTPPASVLRKRLEDWLAKRGKSSNSYRHLCCFGLPKTTSVLPLGDSQSENRPCLNETITLESSDSTAIVSPTQKENDCGLDIENTAPNGSSTPERATEDSQENKENAAYIAHPEALVDLRMLVHSGYPRDQCEQWLGFISKSQPGLKDLPQYWECLAALEEARGEFASAVDCYGRAVIKGADTNDIDVRLDELWEKFSSLSVSAVEPRRTPLKKLAVDKKQIFKSTVIKFALQQKAIKRSNKETGETIPVVNYIVTPVRRSSRRSQSAFRTTPTVRCVDTLDDLDQSIKDTMQFHTNSVLNPGD